jgi:hypothetical protein
VWPIIVSLSLEQFGCLLRCVSWFRRNRSSAFVIPCAYMYTIMQRREKRRYVKSANRQGRSARANIHIQNIYKAINECVHEKSDRRKLRDAQHAPSTHWLVLSARTHPTVVLRICAYQDRTISGDRRCILIVNRRHNVGVNLIRAAQKAGAQTLPLSFVFV